MSQVPLEDLLAIVNDPLVMRHMPLAADPLDEEQGRQWVASKEQLWGDHGYGPWAIVLDDRVAGWGGLQPTDRNEPEVALVLTPAVWGMGKTILERILHEAFDVLSLPYVLVLFPPTRTKVRGLFRLGFRRDGEEIVEGERFLRYRVDAPPARP
jgi:ribosomal-protein-alanine N-acetyltransferase